jgi:hypothetical protein
MHVAGDVATGRFWVGVAMGIGEEAKVGGIYTSSVGSKLPTLQAERKSNVIKMGKE